MGHGAIEGGPGTGAGTCDIDEEIYRFHCSVKNRGRDRSFSQNAGSGTFFFVLF
jgi:hypothetical protein